MNTKFPLKISSHDSGIIGENTASDFLLTNKYTIIERNWRTKHGEIDIIALEADVLVFVEVKRLPSGNIETLNHLLGKAKQKRIAETAKCFLQKHRQYSNSYIRFDVLVIDMPDYEPVYHIKNAFSEPL